VLIRVTLAYLIYDTAYMLVYERDLMFFIHHVVFGAMAASVLGLGRGSIVMMIMMAWGEVTGPLQSCWWLSRRAKCSRRCQGVLADVFTVAFVAVRIVILPAQAAQGMWMMVSGETPLVPYVWCILWTLLLLVAILGGILWALALIRGFIKNHWPILFLRLYGGSLKPSSSAAAAAGGVGEQPTTIVAQILKQKNDAAAAAASAKALAMLEQGNGGKHTASSSSSSNAAAAAADEADATDRIGNALRLDSVPSSSSTESTSLLVSR
jgi:hypothetical protein